MRKLLGSLLAAGMLAAPVLAKAPELAPQVAASREVVGAFGARLKGELEAAMQAGGPANAVEVCRRVAQEIAREESQRRGWEVGRTALKVRNPVNAPDAWERETLALFAQQKAAGAEVAGLERYALVEAAGGETAEGPQFRYMKAIPMGELCLTCHGPAVEPELLALIRRHYPQDQATGFQVGDLRGAFTIAQPMD